MRYYAHPNEDLIDHLTLTGRLAEQYGRRIGISKVAKQWGLLHDVGKHTEKFQNVLSHSMRNIDHAVVAAEVYYTLTNEDPELIDSPSLRAMMCYSMEGHHSSFNGDFDPDIYEDNEEHRLPDDLESGLNFTKDNGKLNALSSYAEFEDILEFVSENNLIVKITEKDHPDLENMEHAERMLFARFLMSCGVDADYTATASLDNPSVLDMNMVLDNDTILKQFQDFYKEKYSGREDESPLNPIRNIVFEEAGDFGRKNPVGIYTLTAPTGTGKTMALMNYALNTAKRNNLERIIVVLPFLSITSQNVKDYKEALGSTLVIEDDSVAEHDEFTRMLSDRWNSPIIVTTSVKFFQTLFSAKAPALRKLHNIANSVVVFDESQTLPHDKTSVTMRTLTALSKLFNTSILLSTATQPVYEFRRDLSFNAREIISDVRGLYTRYRSIRRVITRVENKIYTPEEIVRRFSDEKQFVFVGNTRKDARALYREAKKVYGSENVFFLSGNMCNKHKLAVINEVKRRLKAGLACILCSTQCIELGVDVSFPKGFRAFCPFTSILQMQGRINRNAEYECGYLYIAWLEGKHCPDSYYKTESDISAYLFSDKTEFELEALEYNREYFKHLYAGRRGIDAPAIHNAEEDEDIYEMYKNYHIIDNAPQYSIIVPYEKEMDLFEDIRGKYRMNGYVLSKSDLKTVHGIVVRVYASGNAGSFIKKHCHSLSFNGADSGWFIADMDDIYDEMTGLRTEEEGDDAYIL